jgi:hypothetical protein
LKGFSCEQGYIHVARTDRARGTMTPRDPLDELLERYPAPPEIPRDLTAQFRARISAESPSRVAGWMSRTEAAFARPSFAVAFVIASVLLGLFLAENRLSRLHAVHGAQIARSYLQLIDPLLPAAVPTSNSTGPSP